MRQRSLEILKLASRWINRVAEGLLAVIVAATVLAIFAQVVFRYGLGSSLTWSEEFARYAFVWMIFTGTSVATYRGQNIAITGLLDLLRPVSREILAKAITLVAISFFALFAYLGLILMQNARFQYSSALQISIAWVYAAAPVGAGLSLVHLFANLFEPFSPVGGREAEERR